MRQLELLGFNQTDEAAGTLDLDSQALLERFRERRLSEGANPRSIGRELSQLRSMAKEGAWRGSGTLADVFTDIPLLATILCEPRRPIARSTGLARFVAVQRFIRIIAPLLGRDPQQDRRELDRLLPARTPTGWHTTGLVVAGGAGRHRHRAVSLSQRNLDRIVQGVTEQGTEPWHRTLVMLHCFTGLRPEEIVALRWGDIERTSVPMTEEIRFSISVHRGGRCLALPIISKVAAELAVFAGSQGSTQILPSKFIFPSARTASCSISYRAARYVVTRACREAGVPVVEASDLRAAFAFSLTLQGLSDHQVAAVLGLARVRSLDRLLKGHRALQAQRVAREILETP